MEELISIIIPVYKVEEYLNKCIDSVINQSYKNLEIILVDDGSPDNCPQICDEYSRKDNRIKVIHKKNGGQSEARNCGLDIAKGKYIGFVDSDDYIKEDMFEILYKNMINYDADISLCNIIKIKKKSNENVENYDEIEIYNSSDSIKQLLKQHITNYLPNKLYKREIWEEIRLPEGKILEDMDVMYRLIEKSNKIVATNKTEYYYFIRKDSSISQINTKVTKDLKDAVNKRYVYLSTKMPEVLDLLNITRLQNIAQYYYNLSYCNEKLIYRSEEFNKEYKFYRERFKVYKKELLKEQCIKNKIELYLLYFNRGIYYYYVRTKLKIKKIIKNIKN